MVQRTVTVSPSALQERRSTGGNLSLNITLAEDDSVANAFRNAVAYRETRCSSIQELLKYCRSATSSVPKMQTPHLGVHELESGRSHLPSDVLHPGGPHLNSSRTYIHSPRLYHSKTEPEFNRPKFQFKKFRPKSQSENKEEGKHSFLLGAFNNANTVESVSTALLKENKDDVEMFMPTYTVIVLGELDVGKSALCRMFFRSGIDAEGCETKGNCDYLDSPTGSLDSQGCYQADHYVYERPVNVDGQCTRIRILDINATKHRIECEDCVDFEPYLEVGDAYALVYSVADRETFKTVMDILSRMSKLHAGRSLPIILVGNKSDLVRGRQISARAGVKFAAQYGVKYIETSVPLNQNVIELFEGVIQQIRLRRHDGYSAKSLNAPGTSSQDPEGIASTSKTKEDENAPNKSCTKYKQRSSGSLKKRPKRRFVRRLTEFLGGGDKEASTSKDQAKSCQDLTVL